MIHIIENIVGFLLVIVFVVAVITNQFRRKKK
jgi:hypothetical protein